jgi:hypothetical protein
VSHGAVVTTIVLFVLAVGVAGVALRSRMVFGTFRFWDYPERINYCGRRYYPGSGSVLGSHQTLSRLVDDRPQWKTVARTFTLRRIEGPIRKPSARSQVCTMTLYVSVGRHTYRSYGLSGGP